MEALICRNHGDPTIPPDSTPTTALTITTTHPIPKLKSPSSVTGLRSGQRSGLKDGGGEFDGSLDEINLNLSEKLADNEVSPIPTSLVAVIKTLDTHFLSYCKGERPAQQWKKLNIEEKIDIVLSWPSEEASHVIKGSLDANEDIGFVEFSEFSENKESVKEVVVGGGEACGVGDDELNRVISALKDGGGEFDGRLDEINLNLSEELEDNGVSPIPTSLVAHERPRVRQLWERIGVGSVTTWVAEDGRMVLCYVQGSGRRKRKKGVGCGSGRQENYGSGRRDCGRIRIWDPGIKRIMSSPKDDLAHLKIPLEDILCATNNFGEKNITGTSGFAKGYKGQLLWSGELIDITARRLNKERKNGEQQFWMEISMLSSLKHKNLVSLVGFCDENDEKIIINKNETRGRLDNYLGDARLLTWVRRLEICVGLANGLSYIHHDKKREFCVIHRNIDSATIKLNDDWEPKFSQFERCMKIDASQRHHSFYTDTLLYTDGYGDPTYIETKRVNHKSDIYSFGIVLFEVLCGRDSIIDDDYNKYLAPVAITHYREKKLHEIIDWHLWKQMDSQSFNMFAEIAYECLDEEPSRRPNIDDIVPRLEKALELARDNRPTSLNKNNSQSSHNKGDQSAPKDFYKESGENVNSKSYAHVVNVGPHQFHKKEDSPEIVLDETYANKTDYSLALLGKVKDFTSLTNLNVVLANEDFDEQEDGYLHSKRVCIKTTLVENIYESFKVIIQGKKHFWIRLKEVLGWMPDFEEDIDQDSKSDDDLSNEGSFDENRGLRITPNVEGESDLESVAKHSLRRASFY
ncbi:kinase-like domain, phloem protein 2-like protein [Tanacetum coccineum]